MPEMTHGRFTAVGVGERGKTETFGDDRVCAHVGCGTRLSTYNPRSLCWQHDPGLPSVTATTPRRRRRSHADQRRFLELPQIESLVERST
jgi:hypothetical protein